MSGNALDTLRRHRPWLADMPKALGEYDDALARVAAVIEAARHPEIERDLLWMAEGRSKSNRKHTDDFLVALRAVDEGEAR